ncbi:proteasome subunit beta type-7 [Pseudonaja textilis]|uniref:Proteasome subunit beta n=1 Tax=Pseudonaja textilis TaxID=8673 RepID=A0A670YP05_PSETE|nr:proteasome subunit beta type-7 [Pseudonaja textilis]
MASLSLLEASMPATGGFSFHNTARNAQLESEGAQKGLRLPAARKTGTTIAGVVYKDGIVLGADTRATEGMVVADKNCDKIHFIAPNIYCCGAGTAADTEMTTQMISSNMELHSLSTGRLPRVVTANRMLKQMLFRYQGYIGASLVLGGVDVTGSHLYSIYPHGSTDKLPYVTMGESHSCTTQLRCLHCPLVGDPEHLISPAPHFPLPMIQLIGQKKKAKFLAVLMVPLIPSRDS